VTDEQTAHDVIEFPEEIADDSDEADTTPLDDEDEDEVEEEVPEEPEGA
jgi:hypothetical protein